MRMQIHVRKHNLLETKRHTKDYLFRIIEDTNRVQQNEHRRNSHRMVNGEMIAWRRTHTCTHTPTHHNHTLTKFSFLHYYFSIYFFYIFIRCFAFTHKWMNFRYILFFFLPLGEFIIICRCQNYWFLSRLYVFIIAKRSISFHFRNGFHFSFLSLSLYIENTYSPVSSFFVYSFLWVFHIADSRRELDVVSQHSRDMIRD